VLQYNLFIHHSIKTAMCTACQNKMNGLKSRRKGTKTKRSMKRRRRSRVSGLNSKDIGSVATKYVLPGIAGAIAASFLKKLPFLDKDENKEYRNYAAIVGGLVLTASTKNPMLQAAGIGMAIKGGTAVAVDLLPESLGIGLLPPGVPSVRISGLNGPGDFVPGVLREEIPGVKIR
jgi:hypothetical protein